MTSPAAITPVDQETRADRLASLDALRGLAAMAVVFSHALHVLPAFAAAQWSIPQWQGPESWPSTVIRRTPLSTLVDGHAAVMLFFVLSGLVLARPLLAPRPPAYGAFVCKRVARLYPPYVAALLFSALAQGVLGGRAPHGPSPWLAHNWTDQLHPSVMLDYALMLGRSVALDNPVWSLDYEMRLSLLLPLLFWPMRRRGRLVGPVLALSLLFGGEAVGLHAPDQAAGLAGRLILYGGMFALGATLSLYLPTLRRLALVLPRGAPELAAWAILWLNWRESMMGLGAAVLIAAALGRGPLAWLCARPAAQFLGRISYSLYLLHVPVLMALLALSAGHLPQAAMIAVMPPVAIVVAWLFYRVIEAPSHRLAHSIRLAPVLPLTIGLEPVRERI